MYRVRFPGKARVPYENGTIDTQLSIMLWVAERPGNLFKTLCISNGLQYIQILDTTKMEIGNPSVNNDISIKV